MKSNNCIVILLLVILLLVTGCDKEDVRSSEKLENNISVTSEKKENVGVPLESNSDDEEETVINAEPSMEQKIDDMIDNMTLEEKVAQLFVILPESLMDGVTCVTAAGDMTKNAINDIPVGGFIYLSNNLESEQQVQEMLTNVQKYSMERIGVPAFLCVDEEGGAVTRISGTGKFDVPTIGDMSGIGQTMDCNEANEVGVTMAKYLSKLGFNVDFAPVADVLTNPDNQVVRTRSFGTDSELVSNMSLAFIEGLEENGVYGSYKHFPGHGMTAGDTHEGYAYSEKTLEEIKECELIPFQKGIDEGVSFIMVGHISMPQIIGDNTPSSLSEYMINDVLRNQMGYEGIVITDAMNMGAIVQQYSSSEAAVKSLQAGADIVLMPDDFKSAYEGVMKAVQDGTLSNERINESLRRILYVKLEMKEKMQQDE